MHQFRGFFKGKKNINGNFLKAILNPGTVQEKALTSRLRVTSQNQASEPWKSSKKHNNQSYDREGY